jgi:membrane-associated phospholipid phosphatase
MHRALPFTWLSELLHLFYFSYYLLIPALGLVLYVRRREAFRRFLFASILTFLACIAVFTLFPVLGPNYVFERGADTIPVGPIARSVHRLVDAGSSPGTAFPSSHVAVGVVVLLATLRWARRWTWLFAPVVLGLWWGTVYGVFHYVVDGIAGSLIAAAFFGVSVPVYHAIGGARRAGWRGLRTRADRVKSAATRVLSRGA